MNCEERIKFYCLFLQKYSVSKRGLRYSRDAILNSVKRSFEYVQAPKIFCVKKRDICHAICITIFKRLYKKGHLRRRGNKGYCHRGFYIMWFFSKTSLGSKRFRLVSEQKRQWKGIFGFDRARNETRTRK